MLQVYDHVCGFAQSQAFLQESEREVWMRSDMPIAKCTFSRGRAGGREGGRAADKNICAF